MTIDELIIRMIFPISTIVGIILAYVVIWLLMERDHRKESKQQTEYLEMLMDLNLLSIKDMVEFGNILYDKYKGKVA